MYAAHDPTLGREVAVKVMHAGCNAGRFVVESKVTAQLPHPGVPPVYNLGELPDGRPFLAMKLVEGRTLPDELRAADRVAGLPRSLSVFERICETVERVGRLPTPLQSLTLIGRQRANELPWLVHPASI